MISPKALPDELAQGLLIRAQLLTLGSPTDTLAALAARAAPAIDLGRKCAWAELLAGASGISFGPFCSGHTLMPFRSAVRRAPDCVEFGAMDDALQSYSIGAPIRTGDVLNLCPECVAEDLAFWGFSYWRRSHQLPGCVLCAKHQVALHRVLLTESRVLPHRVVDQSSALDPLVVHSAKTNLVIQRYAEISLALAQRSRPVSTAWMAHILRRRVQMREAQAGRKVRRLTHIADDLIRGPWQRRFFEGIDANSVQINSLDRTCSSVRLPYSTIFYALALAVLFDSADDAMNEVNNSVVDAFVQDVNGETTSGGQGHGLPAAARAFYCGASVVDAARSQGVEVQQLEELLRAATNSFTKLLMSSVQPEVGRGRGRCRVSTLK